MMTLDEFLTAITMLVVGALVFATPIIVAFAAK